MMKTSRKTNQSTEPNMTKIHEMTFRVTEAQRINQDLIDTMIENVMDEFVDLMESLDWDATPSYLEGEMESAFPRHSADVYKISPKAYNLIVKGPVVNIELLFRRESDGFINMEGESL